MLPSPKPKCLGSLTVPAPCDRHPAVGRHHRLLSKVASCCTYIPLLPNLSLARLFKMGETMRFQLISRKRPIRSALRILVILCLFYYFLPTIWYHKHYKHDSSYEKSLYSTRKPKIQYAFPSSTGADVGRLQAVKVEFLHAYKGYKSRAWLKDELKPISGGSHTQYCGWAATLIDTLDTLYIMGLYDEMAECLGIRLITIDR